MAHPRRPYVLRIPPELYEAYEAWAADEFRSMNAQLSAVLTDAARRAGRLRRDLPPHQRPPEPDEGESDLK
ncbi:MAG: Arc family DNA-binding protein [Actinomycetota bacterium]|nr:Arc family DNA-binding protein [Actinomycetota bacterium]